MIDTQNTDFCTIKEIIRQLMEHGGFSYLISIANKLPNDTERKICCLGCKHFFYWNNGGAGCDLDKQYVCTHNNFILREEENDISKL